MMMMMHALLLVLACGVASVHGLASKEGALNVGLKVRGLATTSDLLQKEKGVGPFYFDQLTDHFNPAMPASERSWQQKYFVNDTNFSAGTSKVAFLIIGGEGPLSDRYVSNAFISGEWAEEMGALLVAVEHRYYGESYPVEDTSADSLQYLTSEQALADLARFQPFLKQKYGIEKFILFGGSYSGALAAWGRAKYPHLFAGAFDSSGPVEARYVFTQFLEVVANNLPQDCQDRLGKAYAQADELVTTESGVKQLMSMFQVSGAAPDPSNRLDVSIFMETLTDPVAEVVQYNHDHPNTLDIAEMCSSFVGVSDGDQALVALADFFVDNKKNGDIYGSFKQYIKDLQEPGAMRSWTYQTCAEFSFFQPAPPGSIWSKNVDMHLFLEICDHAYGSDRFLPFCGTNETNINYGSTDIKQLLSNTYCGDGTVDPWHTLAVLPSKGIGMVKLQDSSGAALVNGTAHCADLYGSNNADLPALTAAREFAKGLVQEWIAQES
jgi:pimeloyl-ACP methyl ester carboxylesterase